jgi:hypothetical protein
MINKLIWGLYFEDEDLNQNLYTLINFHRLSITNANKLGYDCVLYTPHYLHKYFTDLTVKLVDIPKVGNVFFDYVKNYILKVEKGMYFIIDGDLILNQRLPTINADLIYEKKEPQSWELFYKNEVETLTNLGIGDIIPEWTGKKRFDILNIGLVYVKEDNFKEIWIDRWDKVKHFVETNIKENQSSYTPIAAQYMLTELVDYYKLDVKDFKTNSSKDTYIHYMGNVKNTISFIPTNKILTFNQTLI